MKKIALTFDDGPNEFTEEILDILKQYDGKSTFFIWGELEEKNKETMKRIADEGHILANHTFTHPDLTKLDESSIREEIEKTDKVLQQYTQDEIGLFRPPYGLINESVEKIIDKKIILWSLDSKDWSEIEALEIEKNIIDKVKENDIVLLHSFEQTTIALPSILDFLKNADFQFATVDEVI